MNNSNNDKKFISQLLGVKGAQEFERQLHTFSNSEATLNARRKAYADTIKMTMGLNEKVLGKNGRKSFADCVSSGASLSASDIAGVSVYSGVMKSYVQSIAPIFSVQRNVDAPVALLEALDFYDVIHGRKVAPNIGKDEAGWSDDGEWAKSILGAEEGEEQRTERVTGVYVTKEDAKTVDIVAGTGILPRSVKIDCLDENKAIVGTIYDDGHGNLIAKPGLLTSGEIVYSTRPNQPSALKFELADDTVTSVKVEYTRDKTAEAKVNRAFGQVKYYRMRTKPLLVPVERNILSDHAMSKMNVINSDELYSNFIENEYTKAINERAFNTLLGNYEGDTWEIDLSEFSIKEGFYDTLIRSFRAMLSQAENALAKQTYKGAKVTGYIAGPTAVNIFDLMGPDMGWVKNTNSTYFKDVVGWYNDVPVVRYDSTTFDESTPKLLEDDEIMLTHKTEDGQLAPLFHGMFLAPTELPVVANYDKLTTYSSGLYSMEGFGFTDKALCVKVKCVLENGDNQFGVQIKKKA